MTATITETKTLNKVATTYWVEVTVPRNASGTDHNVHTFRVYVRDLDVERTAHKTTTKCVNSVQWFRNPGRKAREAARRAAVRAHKAR